MNNNALIATIVVLIIVGVGLYAIFAGKDNVDVSNVSTSTPIQTGTTPSQPTPINENSVTLGETETGNFVTVSSATLLRPGYVVIYRVNSQGTVSVIGNSDLLSTGTHTNLRLQLDSIIAKEQTVVAVLHEDDGDGEFEFPESDFYLGNANMRIANDVDVVDVSAGNEPALLREQVVQYLEDTIGTTSTSTR